MIETSDNKKGATAYLRPPQAETFGPFDLDLVRNRRTIGAIAPSAAEGDCDDAFLRELASRINWEAFMRMALSLVIALALALSATDARAVEGSQDSSIRTFKDEPESLLLKTLTSLKYFDDGQGLMMSPGLTSQPRAIDAVCPWGAISPMVQRAKHRPS